MAQDFDNEEESLPQLPFVYNVPFVSQRKLEVIKTIAKHSILSPDAVEKRKMEFDFMKEGNELYPLFENFVRQYQLIISRFSPPSNSSSPHSEVHNRSDKQDPVTGNDLIQRVILRAARYEEPHPLRLAKKGESLVHRIADASDNWQEFVVLETVEFFQADTGGSSRLPPPLTSSEMQLVRDGKISSDNGRHELGRFKSALTGDIIPEADYNEHIRNAQVDPGFYTQRKIEQQRAQSNVDYEHVAENLRKRRAMDSDWNKSSK